MVFKEPPDCPEFSCVKRNITDYRRLTENSDAIAAGFDSMMRTEFSAKILLTDIAESIIIKAAFHTL